MKNKPATTADYQRRINTVVEYIRTHLDETLDLRTLAEVSMLSTKAAPDAAALADIFKTTILDDMRELRIAVDSMETIMPSEKWPYPSYGQILFDVR